MEKEECNDGRSEGDDREGGKGDTTTTNTELVDLPEVEPVDITSNDDLDNSADLCPICLDSLPDPGQNISRETRNTQYLARIKPCCHLYHDFCIQAWAEKANTCPQCRGRFNTIEIVADHHLIRQIHIDDKLYPLEIDESIPPEFVDETQTEGSELTLPDFHHQHLQNQLCCLCDTSNDTAFAICTECSSGYHLSCINITDFSSFNCPICDSLQNSDSIVGNRAGRRAMRDARASRRASSSGFMQELRAQIQHNRYHQLGIAVPGSVRRRISRQRALPLNLDDDNIDYVSLVNHNKEQERKMKEEKQPHDLVNVDNSEENMAWRILDKLQSGPEPRESPSRNGTVPTLEKKYKRPKHKQRKEVNSLYDGSSRPPSLSSSSTSTRLTEAALQIHDRKTIKPSYHHQRSDLNLSYNQKLIVQRLFLKPVLKNLHLSPQGYTHANKAVSRKLYREIKTRPDMMYWLHSVEEMAERDGIDMRNKTEVDAMLRRNNSHLALRKDLDPLVSRLLREELLLLNDKGH
ncbi:hypothetical protein FOA43_001208 [Brettanomyces nanus]|uniref:RING-type domain-containing protein n=1 Tax=Eeniella nana TaxID=13502 RepID=A0A875RZ16_EENNA|nr:uncharacterized protein FOA43_001208 [Brettanomyces nanus]QPG73893.1 hypothetical protein FOA43_001208 [Brettanomyces nanus]